MRNNVTETPEKWTILQVGNYYKVFASWVEPRWKLNSGIKSITQDEDYYYFEGFSGSVYKCYKKGYGVVTMWCKSVMWDMVEKNEGLVKVLEDRDDWMTLEGELINK